MHKVFAQLPEDRAAALAGDLLRLLRAHNRAGGQSLVVPGEYLEVVVRRR